MSLLGSPKREGRRAVAYYRHSAEDKQENSITIQRRLVEEYAQQRGITIIHEETDEGKSGLSADRPGFQRLLNDWVRNPSAPPFEHILVRDVSRWGRFQNTDEAAFYRFFCRRHGKYVKYVEHGDQMDENNLIAHLLTSVEQFMAAEYSRQLSEKVFHGCVEVSRQGFSAGGTACYGLERVLLDVDKQPVRALQLGEHKAIANQRVTFRPCNDERTRAVRQIFIRCVRDWKTPKEIAAEANEQHTPTATGKSWNSSSVTRILSNPAYTGTRVYNKTWSRLREKTRRNPPDVWVIVPNAFGATVDEHMFEETQRHLYWLSPSQWRAGVSAIRRAQSVVRADVLQLLEKLGYSGEDALELVKLFPVTFSVACENGRGRTQWCFFLHATAWHARRVLAVGVRRTRRNPIDRVFNIPSKMFAPAGMWTTSETEGIPSEYAVPETDLEGLLNALVEETIEQQRGAAVLTRLAECISRIPA